MAVAVAGSIAMAGGGHAGDGVSPSLEGDLVAVGAAAAGALYLSVNRGLADSVRLPVLLAWVNAVATLTIAAAVVTMTVAIRTMIGHHLRAMTTDMIVGLIVGRLLVTMMTAMIVLLPRATTTASATTTIVDLHRSGTTIVRHLATTTTGAKHWPTDAMDANW